MWSTVTYSLKWLSKKWKIKKKNRKEMCTEKGDIRYRHHNLFSNSFFFFFVHSVSWHLVSLHLYTQIHNFNTWRSISLHKIRFSFSVVVSNCFSFVSYSFCCCSLVQMKKLFAFSFLFHLPSQFVILATEDQVKLKN